MLSPARRVADALGADWPESAEITAGIAADDVSLDTLPPTSVGGLAMRYLESADGPSDPPSAERDAAPDMQIEIDLPTLSALDDELAAALANLTTLREQTFGGGRTRHPTSQSVSPAAPSQPQHSPSDLPGVDPPIGPPSVADDE